MSRDDESQKRIFNQHRLLFLLLVFSSGFAGLVYEVLWMKQLGLLFGNTSYAAATTLAAFFGGLAIGSWFWGRRCEGLKNPLRTFAWLEVGIAFTALLYFAVLRGYHAVYPLLYQGLGTGGMLLAVKFALACVLVIPPALFMGGTIPVLGQYLIRERSGFGTTAALLYSVNTLGAALGAFMAGFFLPLWLGFRLTCVAAMLTNTVVAIVAFRLARGAVLQSPAQGESTPSSDAASELPSRSLKHGVLMVVCFVSGFGFLALEVVWTRMFAQVLENSVYTFAAILVIVLLCLAVGAFISSRLARLKLPAVSLLATLLLAGGLAVALAPFIFMELTDSLQILAMRASWGSYIMMIFGKGFLTIGPPAVLLGTVFPFLMKTEEPYARAVGQSLGRLAAINTSGAILGSLVCGFVFMGTFGMWGTTQLIAVVYVVAAVVRPGTGSMGGIILRAAGVFLLMAVFSGLDPTRLPITSIDPMRHTNETILETWETSGCTVAVAQDERGLSLKMNSHYGLGSTGAFRQEQFQADLPLMVYPQTESIFFLGMGTGITAGSSLHSQFENVKRVVVCELVPEVIVAAKKYMTNVDGYDMTGGLFDDPRATVLAEDGRHYLMATREHFDMVNGDLFVPFRSGVGSLYTREHFRNIEKRLSPDGVFFQWIPLYQVTETEFSIIARTMTDVFDRVSLWRANFQPGDEVVALVGHKGDKPLPAVVGDNLTDRLQSVTGATSRDLDRLSLPFASQSSLFFYCGNLSEAGDLFDAYPVNTDDRPAVEYLAPRSYRSQTDAAIPWFVGPRLARLVEEVQRRCPPESDPLLKAYADAQRRLPLAGTAFARARLWQVIGDPSQREASWRSFVSEWTDQ